MPKCEICKDAAVPASEIRDPRAAHFDLCEACERLFFALEVATNA